jgi:hypothetical protein
MIKLPTVIVVGAGGSCAYGFPSGQTLLNDARTETIENLSTYTHKYYGTDRVVTLQQALLESQGDSIDNVLEFRDDLDHLARLYIASRILRAENTARGFFSGHRDWLAYLFQRMDDGCRSVEDFEANPVTFVTYNYDRVIERRIASGLRARYRATDEQLEAFWQKHPVIHLHGSVGSLRHGKDFVPFGARDLEEQQFAESCDRRMLERSSNGIKIVHQADGKTPEFDAARTALNQAERIMFLGFSFGTANVDRMHFSCINDRAYVICSRYHMTDGEVNVQIMQPFAQAGRSRPLVCKEDEDCLAALRSQVHNLVSRY